MEYLLDANREITEIIKSEVVFKRGFRVIWLGKNTWMFYSESRTPTGKTTLANMIKGYNHFDVGSIKNFMDLEEKRHRDTIIKYSTERLVSKRIYITNSIDVARAIKCYFENNKFDEYGIIRR